MSAHVENSSPSTPPVTFERDADGIGWITFDDPGARINVFNAATLAALDAALDATTDARAVVIVSAKEKIFIAGADLKTVAALTDAPTATAFSRAGQKLFQRIADSPVPMICAIHGACAGGGFELALACHWRIASDAAVTRVGLPETSLGTIPGWGGTVRLPRLIGASAALAHLLNAPLLPAHDALRDGLVDEIVTPKELRERAKTTALKLAATGRPVRPPPPVTPLGFFAELRHKTLAKSHGHLPAPVAAIDVVEQAAELAVPAALEAEALAFGTVTVGEVCKNLLHVFFLREAAKKPTLAGWFERPANASLAPISRIGVVGAGVMGSGIAHWFAAHGCEVVLRDVDPDVVNRGLRSIRRLFDETVARKKITVDDADTGLARITATTGWDGFSNCDLVIEAIIESAAAKQKLFSELAHIVPPDTLLASNTSALPIEEIAGHIPHPERVLGLHFFNPVSRMPLVEFVLGHHTSAETAERALAFVQSLGKTPVVCRSSPGFLMTRILFFYLNEAVRLWEDGVPTETLDAALRDFGWPMGPLRLIDEVGIDVTESIFGEMARAFPDRFTRTSACSRLLAAGLRGRKDGASRGFYRYEGLTVFANDEATRALMSAAVPDTCHLLNDKFSEASGNERIACHLIDDKCAHLMAVMIDEARRCLAEGVVRSPDDIDFALLSGAGFPAFRGGLMRYAAANPPVPPPLPLVLETVP